MKEIVIKISDETYEQVLKCQKGLNHYLVLNVLGAIANGKVLPKGHGELKDTNEILAKTHAMQKDLGSNNDRVWEINKPKYKALAYANRFIIDAPTLIEADKGEEKPEAKHIHDLEDTDEMVEKMNRNFKDRCFKETINNIIKTTKGDTK